MAQTTKRRTTATAGALKRWMDRQITVAIGLPMPTVEIYLHAWVTTCAQIGREPRESFRLCIHIGNHQIVAEEYDLQKTLRTFVRDSIPQAMVMLGRHPVTAFDPISLGC